MRSVSEQLNAVLATAVTPPAVRVAISEAHGLLCAEEVVASQALPAFDQAAVDGYAVRSVDVAIAADGHPVVLPVVGSIEAGMRTPHRLQPQQTVYVETGAALPAVADAVVPRSNTQGGGARVSVTKSVASGAFVRRTGEDVQPGDIAVRSGAFIGAAQVGLLAAVGRARCWCTRDRGCRSFRSETSSWTRPGLPGRDRSMTSIRSRSRRPPGTPARTRRGSASRPPSRTGSGSWSRRGCSCPRSW